jgi:cysteine desulfurase
MYYLDNAATTPLTDKVKNKIIEVLDDFGNPSSSYDLGKKTRNIIEDARESVSKFIHAPANSEIIFTSSGSAANSLAISGLVKGVDKYCLFYSPTAHKSMIKCCLDYRYHHELKVDKYGFIDLEDLERQLEKCYPDQSIVCFEAASSEIGTIQRILEITKLVHYYHGIVVVDLTGYIPYFKVNVLDLGVDIATFSGHKLHALKGVGVLYKLEDIYINPIIYGSQENGLFAGTENVVGIASLGEAIKNYKYDFVMGYQRDCLWEMFRIGIPNCYLVGTNKEFKRLPFNLYVCFKGINGSDLVALLETKGIYVSTGSACNNGDSVPSSALIAIGIPTEDINSCIRITFSGQETYFDIENIYKCIKECIEFLRG